MHAFAMMCFVFDAFLTASNSFFIIILNC